MCFPHRLNHSTRSHLDGLYAFDFDYLTPNYAWHKSLIASDSRLRENGFVFMKQVKPWQFRSAQEICVEDEQ